MLFPEGYQNWLTFLVALWLSFLLTKGQILLHCSRSGNSTLVYVASILFNLWAAPWAEAASVGKKSVQSGQSERYIHYV